MAVAGAFARLIGTRLLTFIAVVKRGNFFVVDFRQSVQILHRVR
jgi:hypothetical protein